MTPAGVGWPVRWPRWTALAYLGTPSVIALVAAFQRDALFPPGWPAAVAAVAALPWILGGLGVRLPGTVFTVVALGAPAALLLLDPISAREHDLALFLPPLVAFRMGALGAWWEGLASTLVGIGVGTAVQISGHLHGAEIWAVGIVLGWAMGLMTKSQLRLVAELQAAHAGLVERAAADERRRIARELHDAVAHSMSVTMLHVTGARLTAETDSKATVEALREAERLGRQSLTDIRRTVGLLSSTSSVANAALPGAADLSDLISDFARAGLDVRLDVTGNLGTLPPATGLALYRIVQESLTNVLKHAPAPRADVAIEIDDEGVRVKVRNECDGVIPEPVPNADGALGILGMRERASILGGRLRAGPNERGWLVEATLPRAYDVS